MLHNKRITITEELTYEDVLIQPQFSNIISRKNTDLSMPLTKNITLKLPIISSNMDTITEDKMAIAMAKCGGMGIIHRYCSIKEQCEMVKNVKRYTNHIIKDPWSLNMQQSIKEAIDIIKTNKVGSLLITNDNNCLVGILTQRDINKYIVSKDYTHKQIFTIEDNIESDDISNFMTGFDNVIAYEIEGNDIHTISETNEYEILQLCLEHSIEQIPIINNRNEILGLITLKDIMYRNQLKKSHFNLDNNRQLVVGAAVGVVGDYLERTKKLIEAGVNIICIDIAHGHHRICGETIQKIKQLYPTIEIIAGNVCTAQGVEYLANCGADCVKVGIGP